MKNEKKMKKIEKSKTKMLSINALVSIVTNLMTDHQ
jgi:hypothetical protein